MLLVDAYTAYLLFSIDLPPSTAPAFTLVYVREATLRVTDPNFVPAWNDVKRVDQDGRPSEREDLGRDIVLERGAAYRAVIRRCEDLNEWQG